MAIAAMLPARSLSEWRLPRGLNCEGGLDEQCDRAPSAALWGGAA